MAILADIQCIVLCGLQNLLHSLSHPGAFVVFGKVQQASDNFNSQQENQILCGQGV